MLVKKTRQRRVFLLKVIDRIAAKLFLRIGNGVKLPGEGLKLAALNIKMFKNLVLLSC
jgi:hypothetical protein